MATDPDLKTFTDPEKIRALQSNAKRLERHDIVRECQQRLYELGGKDFEDPIEIRLWEVITAYEDLLREEHGKRQKATYTRRKIEKKGVLQTLTDWALNQKVTPGFEKLIENDLAKFTGEYVVVEFQDYFLDTAAAAAKVKLQSHGVLLE